MNQLRSLITLLGFFNHVKVIGKLALFRESHTIDSCELFAGFITSPVSAGNIHQLHGLDKAGIGGMRSSVKISKIGLSIKVIEPLLDI